MELWMYSRWNYLTFPRPERTLAAEITQLKVTSSLVNWFSLILKSSGSVGHKIPASKLNTSFCSIEMALELQAGGIQSLLPRTNNTWGQRRNDRRPPAARCRWLLLVSTVVTVNFCDWASAVINHEPFPHKRNWCFVFLGADDVKTVRPIPHSHVITTPPPSHPSLLSLTIRASVSLFSPSSIFVLFVLFHFLNPMFLGAHH